MTTDNAEGFATLYGELKDLMERLNMQKNHVSFNGYVCSTEDGVEPSIAASDLGRGVIRQLEGLVGISGLVASGCLNMSRALTVTDDQVATILSP